MCLFCSFRSSFQNSACSFQKQRKCRYSNFPYFSGFLRCTRQKSLKYQAFRQIQCHPKPPSKITKLPPAYKTRNQFASNRTCVRIPSSPPTGPHKPSVYAGFYTYIAVAKKYASSILGSKSRCKVHILLPNGISAFLNCQKMRGRQKADSAKAKLPYFLP